MLGDLRLMFFLRLVRNIELALTFKGFTFVVACGGLLDLFITARLMIIFWDSKVYFPLIITVL